MPVVAPRPEASECNLSSLSETRLAKQLILTVVSDYFFAVYKILLFSF